MPRGPPLTAAVSPLSPVEIRVLGALAEKALATPEYYPLSLNALVTACNQKTGREPVMELTADQVTEALHTLARRRLVGTTSGAGSRVEKYRHLLEHTLGLSVPEVAALAVLMLRGPQTAGEVRARTARMHAFDSLGAAEAVLRALAAREEPLVVELPLPPGRKEPRFAHRLGGEVAETVVGSTDEAAALARRVEALEAEVEALKQAFEAFREQFE